MTIDHEGVERLKRWRVFGNNVVVKWDAFAVKRRVYRPDTARLILRLKSWKPKVAFLKSNFSKNVCAAALMNLKAAQSERVDIFFSLTKTKSHSISR